MIFDEKSGGGLGGSATLAKGQPILVNWHIHMYMPKGVTGRAHATQSKNLHEQPQSSRAFAKEFQFNTEDVFIRKEGGKVVLSPRPFDWTSYLSEGPVASANFMADVEDLPAHERER